MQPHELPPPVRMVELLGGFRISQALYAAAALGVADQLMAGPAPVEALAEQAPTSSAIRPWTPRRSGRRPAPRSSPATHGAGRQAAVSRGSRALAGEAGTPGITA